MSAALEVVARVLLAIGFFLCAVLTAVAIGVLWLVTREHPAPVPRRRAPVMQDDADVCEEAYGSHPQYRGVAPAAPEGLGPRIARRDPSPTTTKRLAPADQEIVDEILGKRGHRR